MNTFEIVRRVGAAARTLSEPGQFQIRRRCDFDRDGLPSWSWYHPSPDQDHTTNSKSKLRQRTDGRLDRTRDPAILNAAVAALTENGYTATNMNEIAARAGVGKAAIYRRWSSKAALITDALL